MIGIVVETADSVSVISGAAGISLLETLECIKEAESMGTDAASVVLSHCKRPGGEQAFLRGDSCGDRTATLPYLEIQEIHRLKRRIAT